MPPKESGCFEPVVTTTVRVDDAAGLAAGEGQVRDLGLGGRETRSSLNGGAQRKRGAARALIVNDRR